MVQIPTAETAVETKKARKAREVAEKKAAAEAAALANPPVEGATPEATKAPAEPKAKDPNALTGREALALHFLAGAPRIGAELGARMGKGISRMMGCAVKNNGVSPGLCGRGFAEVKIVEAGEGKTRHEYHLTHAGRTALTAATTPELLAKANELETAYATVAAASAEEKAEADAKKAAAAKAATTVPTAPAPVA